MTIDEQIEEAKHRAQERRDNKVQILIINKEKDEIVERGLEYSDVAERWAKNKIWNRPYLKYKIIFVT